MADAFLSQYGRERYEALSAGLEPKGIHPLVVQVMEEIGIDMSRHEPKS